MPEYPNQPEMQGNASPPNFPEHLNFSAESSISFDADEFLHFLDDQEWTVEQKREYVQAMWALVTALLDWNFRFHPVQEAIDQAKHLERESPK